MQVIQSVLDIFNGNVGFVTFIVGGFALYVYIKQRKDKKRDAAHLILQEVRYAEQKIRRFRESNPPSYSLSDRLLPTSSWNENINLFIKDLSESEIDMISAFYAKAHYIDHLIQKRSEQKTAPQNILPQWQPVVAMQNNNDQQGAPVQNPPQFVQFQTPPASQAEEVTIGLLQNTSFSIEYIYNSTVVEKLRKIAIKNWYELW